MKKTKLVAVIATAVTIFATPLAVAQEANSPAVDTAYQEIEAAFGSVPSHIKGYPKSAIAGAWEMTKGLLSTEGNALEPKVKSLINLAVAAQIPCQYCIWLETKFAKAQGATDQEVSEAVAQAAYVRMWSTVINGLQIPMDTFKAEFGGD